MRKKVLIVSTMILLLSITIPFHYNRTQYRYNSTIDDPSSKISAIATPPSVTITSPSDNEYIFSSTFTLSWSGSDPDGMIMNFSIYVDNAYYASVYSNISSHEVTVTEGWHDIAVKAIDDMDESSWSNITIFYNPPSPPWIDITSPSNYSTQGDSFTLTWNSGTVDSVITDHFIYVNDSLYASLDSTYNSCLITLNQPGWHEIEVRVKNNHDLYDSEMIYILVSIEQLFSGSVWLWDEGKGDYPDGGYLFSNESKVHIGSSDLYYGDFNGPSFYTNNGDGHIIDLGTIDYYMLTTLPSSGWTSNSASAYEGHVYGIQTRNASAYTYAKILVKKIDYFGIWFDYLYQANGSLIVPGHNTNGLYNPLVNINSPLNGSAVFSPFNLSWDQGADGYITSSAIYANGSLLTTVTNSSVNISVSVSGFYTISIIVTDDEGGRNYDSIAVMVTVPTPPTVHITTPGNNSWITGEVEVNFTYSGGQEFTDAHILIDDAPYPLGDINISLTGTSGNGSVSFDMGTASIINDGWHKITVVVTDILGLTTEESVFVFRDDYNDPSMVLLSPDNGSVIHGTFIIGIYLFAEGLDYVDYYISEIFQARLIDLNYEYYNESFSLFINTSSWTEGIYHIKFVAGGMPGDATELLLVITVEEMTDSPPWVTITSPFNSSVTDSIFTLSWNSGDIDGWIEQIELYIDGNLNSYLGNMESGSYTVNLTGRSSGWHHIQLKVTDNEDYYSWAGITVWLMPDSPVDVLYIHGPHGTNYYQNYENLFSYSSVVSITGINIDDLIGNLEIASGYDVLIIGNSAFGNWDSPDSNKSNILKSLDKPLLALGNGGATFFEGLGYSYGGGAMSFTCEGISVSTAQSSHGIFSQTYSFSVPGLIYIEPTAMSGIYMSSDQYLETFVIARDKDFTNHAPLVENTAFGARTIYFGHQNYPTIQSDAYKLIHNILEWLAGRSATSDEPWVQITYPYQNMTLSADFQLQWNAGSESGIEYIDIYLDNILLVSGLLGSQQSYPIPISIYNGGYHELTITVTSYNSATSTATVSFFYETGENYIHVEITSPLNGTEVSGILMIEYSFDTKYPVFNAEFYIDETFIDSLPISGTLHYYYNSSEFSDGWHNLKIIARNTEGVTGQFEITLYFSNGIAPEEPYSSTSRSTSFVFSSGFSLIETLFFITGLLVINYRRRRKR